MSDWTREEKWSGEIPLSVSELEKYWDSSVKEFQWLQHLEGVPQEPSYHGEGDVLVHTKMVLQEILSHPSFEGLEEPSRSILFFSALLHDVGKPACTKEENGVITSKNHSRKGAFISRILLWKGLPKPLPFFCREHIVHLVRHHGLPLWLLEKRNSEHSAVQASLALNTSLLSLLAQADMRGRICDDREKFLERIALFEEFCKEKNCWEKPFEFTSKHHRYVYFNRSSYPLYGEAYDDSLVEVILLSGLPGSGKDTWIAKNASHLPTISLDALRREMGISPGDNQGKVIQKARDLAKDFLRKKQPFVWNATNLSRMLRKDLIDFFTAYKARVRIVYIEVEYEKLLHQNRHREYPVPEDVLENMMDKWEVPCLDEAHEVEWWV